MNFRYDKQNSVLVPNLEFGVGANFTLQHQSHILAQNSNPLILETRNPKHNQNFLSEI